MDRKWNFDSACGLVLILAALTANCFAEELDASWILSKPPREMSESYRDTIVNYIHGRNRRLGDDGSFWALYPDPRLGAWYFFRLRPNEVVKYKEAFGIAPITVNRATSAAKRANLVLQALNHRRALGDKESAFYPFYLGEMTGDYILDQGVSTEELKTIGVDARRTILQERIGISSEPPGLSVPIFVAAAALGPASFTANAVRMTAVVAGSEFGSDLARSYYQDYYANDAFDNTTSYLRRWGDFASFANIALSIIIAEEDAAAASVFRAFLDEQNLPDFYSLEEPQLAQQLRRDIPGLSFKTIEEELALSKERDAEKTHHEAEELGAGAGVDDPVAAPPNDRAPSVDSIVGNTVADVRQLVSTRDTFDKDEWKAKLFAAEGTVRLATFLTAASSPELAGTVARIGHAALDIGHVAYQYNQLLVTATDRGSEALKNWANVGMYTGVAAIGLSLLQSTQPDPTMVALEQVLMELQQIKMMIADLYELTREGFAHLEDRLTDLHNATQASFAEIDSAVLDARRGIATSLLLSDELRDDIRDLRGDLYGLGVSQFEQTYPSAVCEQTASGLFKTLDERRALFEECSRTLLQQLRDSEGSTILVRGAGVPLDGDPKVRLNNFLHKPSNIEWFRPERAYPVPVSLLPFHWYSLSAISKSLSNNPIPIPQLNPEAWKRITRDLLFLVHSNPDLATSTSYASAALRGAREGGERIQGAMNALLNGAAAEQTLSVGVEVLREAASSFGQSLVDLEKAYFDEYPSDGVAYLHDESVQRPTSPIDAAVARMAPCEEAKASYDAKKLIPIPPQVTAEIDRIYLVAEKLRFGRLVACYKARYLPDGFATNWAYNTPNSAVVNVSSKAEVTVIVTFFKDKDKGEVALERGATVVNSIMRETVSVPKGPVAGYTWDPKGAPGTKDMFATGQGSWLAATVTSLDRQLEKYPVSSDSWRWKDPIYAPASKDLKKAVSEARGKVRTEFLKFASIVVSGAADSTKTGDLASISRVIENAAFGSDEFVRLAARILGGRGGLLERLRQVEIRRSFIYAILETLVPPWNLHADLYAALMSDDISKRILDGRYFLVVLQALGNGDKNVPMNAIDLMSVQRTRIDALSNYIKEVTTSYAENPEIKEYDIGNVSAMIRDVERAIAVVDRGVKQ